jgi:peptidyl-prolyl cis-trans isomerase C
MNKHLFVIAAAGGLALSACDQGGLSSSAGGSSVGLPTVSRDDAAVLVNGRAISKESVELLSKDVAQRRGGESVPKDKIVDELVKREILRQQAEKDQLLKDPSVAARVDNAVRMVLSQVEAEALLKKFMPSDEEVRKEYDQRVGAMKASEYKARHILVESEKSALDVIKRLEKGENFAAIAKKLSKDPGSKNSGGDLGWFSPQQMVPPFANAVIGLKNGETTKAPVKTDFGWHVIQREDSREQEAPSFDSVKAQVVSLLQSDKLQKYLEDEKSKAKVETLIKLDEGAADKAKAPAPPGTPAAPGTAGEAPAANDPSGEDSGSVEAGGPVEVEEETVIEEQVPPEEDVPDDEQAAPDTSEQ